MQCLYFILDASSIYFGLFFSCTDIANVYVSDTIQSSLYSSLINKIVFISIQKALTL